MNDQNKTTGNPDCKYCYGKGYHTRCYDEIGSEDFGGEEYVKRREMEIIPCKKCSKGNQEIIETDHKICSDCGKDHKGNTGCFAETSLAEVKRLVEERDWDFLKIEARKLLNYEQSEIYSKEDFLEFFIQEVPLLAQTLLQLMEDNKELKYAVERFEMEVGFANGNKNTIRACRAEAKRFAKETLSSLYFQ